MKTLFESNVIDRESGEVYRSQKVKTKKIEYYYTQVNDDLVMEDIMRLTGQEIKLIMMMEGYADHQTNEPLLSKGRMDKILNNLDISRKTFYNMKSSLKRKAFIIKHKGVDIVNPHYLWRGSTVDRENLLEEIKEERLNRILT